MMQLLAVLMLIAFAVTVGLRVVGHVGELAPWRAHGPATIGAFLAILIGIGVYAGALHH